MKNIHNMGWSVGYSIPDIFAGQSPYCVTYTDCSNGTTSSFNLNNSNNQTFQGPVTSRSFMAVEPSIAPLLTPTHHITCFPLKLTIPAVQNASSLCPIQPINASVGNVFIVVPSGIGFTQNWQFVVGNTTYTNNVDANYIYLGSLQSGGTIEGELCGELYDCDLAQMLDIWVGYNCDYYPTGPFVPYYGSNCFEHLVQYNLQDPQTIDVQTSGKQTPVNFYVCEPFTKSTNFYIQSGDGDVYPSFIQILPTVLPPHLNINAVRITRCNPNNTQTATLTPVGQAFPGMYQITPQNMIDIGIPSEVMSIIADNNSSRNCITVEVEFEPECGIVTNQFSLQIQLGYHLFCDLLIQTQTVTTNQAQVNVLGTTCTDCFTITKTATINPVDAWQTEIFNIEICGNNISSSVVTLTDLLPQNFQVIPPFLPSTVSVPAVGCTTLTVSGYYTTVENCPDAENKVTMITPANSILTASDCPNVMVACYDPNNTWVIQDGATISSQGWGASTTGTTILILGTLIINQNFDFYNCNISVYGGGQIIVNSGYTLKLDNTIIEGCYQMWQGVKLQNGANIKVLHDSWIRDADQGINVIDNSNVYILQSKITDCVRSVFLEPLANCHVISNTYFEIDESEFGMVRPSFLLKYNNQLAHGLKPIADIELNNVREWNVKIGTQAVYAPNQFYYSNAGMVVHNSRLDIYNTTFRNIQQDNFYTEPWNGTATVSVGSDAYECISNNLNVFTIAGVDNIKDCYRGIYTDFSGLGAYGVKILNAHTGIFSTRCPYLQSCNVKGCTITATDFGIDWTNNVGAKGMYVNSNLITVNGNKQGACIRFAEFNNFANYDIENNDLYAVDVKNGIFASGVLKPKIIYNRVYQNTLGNPALTSEGILINACVGATVTCNTINKSIFNFSIARGIEVNGCQSYSIECNHCFFNNIGFFFGGDCTNSQDAFKGNSMTNCQEGLYLNMTALISTQSLRGNEWINNLGIYGAENQNSGPQMFLSQFDVNNTPFQKPLTPTSSPNNTGWFQFNPGPTYACTSNPICDPAAHNGEDNAALRYLIARDSTITSAFIPEAKNIAKKNLFDVYMQDSIVLHNDSVMNNFYLNNVNGSIGKLYEAKQKLKASNEPNAYKMMLLNNGDSLVTLKKDSIDLIDSLFNYANFIGYETLRDNLIAGISTIQQTQSIILAQINQTADSALDQMQIVNATVVTTEIPEINERFLNDIHAIYNEQGIDGVKLMFNDILAIAQQCPYRGGNAVYIARNYIAMLGDTIIYDDASICLQQGIFRQGTINELPIEVYLKPNPADEYVEIFISNNNGINCSIKILDVLGKLHLNKLIDCKQKVIRIDTKQLSAGVYSVAFISDAYILKANKLIIER